MAVHPDMQVLQGKVRKRRHSGHAGIAKQCMLDPESMRITMSGVGWISDVGA